MSSHSHFVPTHRITHRSRAVGDVRSLGATEVASKLSGMLMSVGALGVLAGVWGGIAPFIGPTLGFTADSGNAWHWDLARGMLAALPGAAAVVAGLLVMACARSSALGIGKGGITFAGMVMFSSGAWLEVGPSAWPVLWNQGYFVRTSALADFGRTAGFAAGPGVLLAALAGLGVGALVLRAHGYVAVDEIAPEGSTVPAETGQARAITTDTDLIE